MKFWKQLQRSGIFLNFRPGLVGGHCIGVDPYYLIHKSQQVGIILIFYYLQEKLMIE